MLNKIKLRGIKIKGITNDSRLVKPGYAFVAYQGVNEDLHKYIAEARRKGAVLIVGEKGEVDRRVPDGRVALAEMAAEFYKHPADKLKLIGVTGTNGKTSTAKMLAAILGAGYIGTLGYDLTTPDPVSLHKFLRKFVDQGKKYVVMETTSQGLEQKRLYGLRFEVGIFTNLTRDHLDYHQDMESYLKAKLILFNQSRIAVLNESDPASEKIYQKICQKKSRRIRHKKVVYYRMYKGKLAMKGEFNRYNAGAARAAARSLGVDDKVIAKSLAKVTVPGRFELVEDRVIVDYAHTPDALERILENARKLVGKTGRLILVFGCGGDRDQGKRSQMGEISSRLADYTIITSDNPRTEAPEKIIKDIQKGIRGKKYEVVANRRRAIKKAVEISGKEDIVVLAGKGHEDYQILGTRKIHFDDREEARKALGRYKKRKV